jgi:DNA-binding transcriptional regulator YiaG
VNAAPDPAEPVIPGDLAADLEAIPGRPGWFRLRVNADRYPDHDLPVAAAGFAGLRYSKRTKRTHRYPAPPDRAYGEMPWTWSVAAAVVDETTSEGGFDDVTSVNNSGGWAVQVAASIDQELEGVTTSLAVSYFDAHGWENVWDLYDATQIPERQQVVVTLRLDGWVDEDIAEELSSTAAAVRQDYHRAMAKMQSLLESPDVSPNVTERLYTYRGTDCTDAAERTRAMVDRWPGNELAAARITFTEAKALREAAGLSLRAVAQMIGTPPSTVARWEQGTRSPRPSAASRKYVALVETWKGSTVAICHSEGVSVGGIGIRPHKAARAPRPPDLLVLSERQMRRRREREISVDPELMALDRAKDAPPARVTRPAHTQPAEA